MSFGFATTTQQKTISKTKMGSFLSRKSRAPQPKISEEKRQRNGSHLQICVLGEGGVGKTAYTIRFCSDCFVTEYAPTISGLFSFLFEEGMTELKKILFQIRTEGKWLLGIRQE